MEVGRAAAIISRLREFVRGREVHRSSVDILQSVRHAVELMQPLARGKGVILAIKAGPGIPIVHADAIQIEQVIVNLVANAIDAVAELPERRRRVTVSAHLSGGEREAGTPHATAGEEREMSHGGCALPLSRGKWKSRCMTEGTACRRGSATSSSMPSFPRRRTDWAWD